MSYFKDMQIMVEEIIIMSKSLEDEKRVKKVRTSVKKHIEAVDHVRIKKLYDKLLQA